MLSTMVNQRHSSYIRAVRASLGWLLLCCVFFAPSVGAIDYTPHGTQPGLTWSLESPDSCEGCHRSFTASNQSFIPYDTWSGSMMANATRDPLFWAALDVANHDLPGVGDYCLRCHTPSGWFGERVFKTATVGQTVNGQNGCLLQGTYDRPDTKGNDYAGITCHYCHRMMPAGPSGKTTAIGNSRLWLDDQTECTNPDGSVYGGPCRRGPYRYQSGSDPLEPPHGWTQSAFHASSDICGSCHNVDSPDTPGGPLRTLILNDGTNTGLTFPIERTYSEWQRSDFSDVVFRDRLGDALAFVPALNKGQTCQDCHMRVSQDSLARACVNNPAGSRTGNLPVHEFVGANTWIPAILKSKYGPPGQLNRESAFDRTIAWAREMLTQRSVNLAVSLDPFVAGQSTLVAKVKVTNLSGHKLPTGYSEGRRMWVNVVARDASNNIVFESGAYDAATAVLTEDAQARVYEVLQGIWDTGSSTCKAVDNLGRKQFHFVLNNCIAKDNRIPPLGFSGGADVSLRPVGGVYPPEVPGSSRLVNYDNATYSIPVAAGTALPITVSVNLKFQISSREYMEFLQREANVGGFAAENTMCQAGPDRPFTVGPQSSSRGQYAWDLWNDSSYGKSPPEVMRTASAATGN
ncbi:MAG: hypothetical protein ABI411_08595 [Tahibacter sp.]